jgi:tRNA (guanine37-N1)-methyltransferase
LTINILTIFPEMFDALNHSLLKRAQERNLLRINLVNIRDYSNLPHKNTDDYPYGGGAGMLMLAQPIASAIDALGDDCGHKIFLSPRGTVLTQNKVKQLAKREKFTLLCGHYEGVDQRVIDQYIDEEISIGDYILTGGELPAMILVDCVARYVDGVLGSSESTKSESFSGTSLLEYPQYTRPREFQGMEVPEVLLNGNHALIEQWRREQSLRITFERRPELLENVPLKQSEIDLIDQWRKEKDE